MKIEFVVIRNHWPIFNHILNVILLKIHQHFAGHMPKMAAIPIYGKNTLKINLLFRNHWADFDEALYEASGFKPVIIFANYDPGFTLANFTPRSNFAT